MNTEEFYEKALARIEQRHDELKVPGVNYDINKRWEEGQDHSPQSIALYKRIARLDYLFQNSSLDLNGEQLMYLLDIIFEEGL